MIKEGKTEMPEDEYEALEKQYVEIIQNKLKGHRNERKRQIGNGFILCCLRRYTALQGGADDETEHIRTLENNYR